jgi:fatty-acyl-CoA synthase
MTVGAPTPPATLAEALVQQANQIPERLAFADGETELSFAQLAERACARAGALQRAGVRPGSHVALVMSAGLPFVEVFWALQLIGAVPCALNPSLPTATLAPRIERICPALVVTDELARDVRTGPPVAIEPQAGADSLAFLQLTSGTSGEPRAAMIAHRSVLASLRGLAVDRNVVAGDVVVNWMPPWHDFGLVRFLIGALVDGLSCHILQPTIWSIPEWLQTITRVSATVTGGPDSAYRLASRMVRPASVDLCSLRCAISGGEPVRASTIETFEQRFSIEGVIMPGYGQAEATVGVTIQRPGERLTVDARGTVACGPPISGLELQAGTDIDHPEEIRVRGEAVFSGYLDAPEETARVLRDGWLHTGDSGYLDGAGRLYVLGRRSGMLKRFGSVVAPRELEEAAEQVEGVRIAAAIGIPGKDGEDEIVVAVETRSRQCDPDAVRTDVLRRVAAAVGFAPRRVCVLAPRTIPRTDNGKVRHAALAELLDERRLT